MINGEILVYSEQEWELCALSLLKCVRSSGIQQIAFRFRCPHNPQTFMWTTGYLFSNPFDPLKLSTDLARSNVFDFCDLRNDIVEVQLPPRECFLSAFKESLQHLRMNWSPLPKLKSKLQCQYEELVAQVEYVRQVMAEPNFFGSTATSTTFAAANQVTNGSQKNSSCTQPNAAAPSTGTAEPTSFSPCRLKPQQVESARQGNTLHQGFGAPIVTREEPKAECNASASQSASKSNISDAVKTRQRRQTLMGIFNKKDTAFFEVKVDLPLRQPTSQEAVMFSNLLGFPQTQVKRQHKHDEAQPVHYFSSIETVERYIDENNAQKTMELFKSTFPLPATMSFEFQRALETFENWVVATELIKMRPPQWMRVGKNALFELREHHLMSSGAKVDMEEFRHKFYGIIQGDEMTRAFYSSVYKDYVAGKKF